MEFTLKGVLMNRRMFLKAGSFGFVHQGTLLALGPAMVCQGNRRLKDITAEELTELVALAGIAPEDVTTTEEAQRERARPVDSLHSQHYFEYREGKPDTDLHDRIWFEYWWCDETDDCREWKKVDGCIEIGEVRTHEGYSIASPAEQVKWFLEHGFKVW